MKVRCIKPGFINKLLKTKKGERLKPVLMKVGEVFELPKDRVFSPDWMEEVEAKAAPLPSKPDKNDDPGDKKPAWGKRQKQEPAEV